MGAGAAAFVGGRRLRAVRSLGPREAAEARVRELERALPRLGLPLGPGATLTTVERTLRESAKPAAARYAARLRAHRFSAGGAELPARARRALRRDLGGGGLRRRLRAWRALPPGGPRL